ncbi:MAG: polyhydroxybutyrate depolymerase [Actinomycetota bacterium]|jgi:polyhydroxybutyrate depolymerase|nr:polyhydroxybutyrate depolymerase [Actinomycetota bacterium]
MKNRPGARCQGAVHRAGTVLFIALLAACSSSSSSPSAAPAPSISVATTTSSTVPGSKPSAGCAHAGARAARGDAVRQVTTAGVVHPYLLAVPADSQPAHPAPLVLLFHGYGSDAREFAALTRMPTVGPARGVIVVTPDGPGRTWQLSGTGTDAQFVDAVVASLAKTMCVDLHRVYAAGFSQGAAFTIFYTCARPGRVAALATVAVDFQLGCKKPVPYLAFHGTEDPAVPYKDGAMGASLPGVKVRGTLLNLSDWARLDRCGATPTTRTIGTEVTLRRWPHCTNTTAVELYTIDKGSHTWPGADPAASPFYTTKQIDATELMLAFFAEHRSAGS